MKQIKSYATGFKAGVVLGKMATVLKADDPAFNLGLAHGRIVRKAGEDIARTVFVAFGPLFEG